MLKSKIFQSTLLKKKLRNTLLSLVLFLSFSQLAFAQDFTQDTKPDLNELNQIATELSKESTISESQQIEQELKSKLELVISTLQENITMMPEEISQQLQPLIQNSNPNLMSLPQLLKLTKALYNWQTQQSMTYSTSVLEELSSMKSLSIQLSECLSLANKAILSNKEDTEAAIELFSSALEEVEEIKKQKELLEFQWQEHLKLDYEKDKRFSNLYTLGNILVPLAPIGVGICSIIPFSQGDIRTGTTMLYSAGISLISLELIYQGGHFIFKFW